MRQANIKSGAYSSGSSIIASVMPGGSGATFVGTFVGATRTASKSTHTEQYSIEFRRAQENVPPLRRGRTGRGGTRSTGRLTLQNMPENVCVMSMLRWRSEPDHGRTRISFCQRIFKIPKDQPRK